MRILTTPFGYQSHRQFFPAPRMAGDNDDPKYSRRSILGLNWLEKAIKAAKSDTEPSTVDPTEFLKFLGLPMDTLSRVFGTSSANPQAGETQIEVKPEEPESKGPSLGQKIKRRTFLVSLATIAILYRLWAYLEANPDKKEILLAIIAGWVDPDAVVKQYVFQMNRATPSYTNELLSDYKKELLDPNNPRRLQVIDFHPYGQRGNPKIHAWYVPPVNADFPTVLFTNGLKARIIDTQRVMHALIKQGYGFIAYDYPGNGDSQGEASESNYVDAVKACSDYLERNPLNPLFTADKQHQLLMGYSLGGNVTAHYEGLYETLPRIPINNDTKDYKGIVLISAPDSFADVYGSIREDHFPFFAPPKSHIPHYFFNANPWLPSITIPFALVYGLKDDVVNHPQATQGGWDSPQSRPKAYDSDNMEFKIYNQVHSKIKYYQAMPGLDHLNIMTDGKSISTIVDFVNQIALPPETPYTPFRGHIH